MNLLEVLVVAVSLSHVEGNPECDQAQEESTACQANAVATYNAEEVKPTGELGEKWLEIEARRNCRFISSLNTCIDDLVAVCPYMLRAWTNIVLDLLDTVQENQKWDTEKCPGAVALKAKEGKGVDCEAAEAKFSSCHKAAKERFDMMRAGGADGKENFLERKVCNWITEDYEQCLKQRVESNCGYDQEEANKVIVQAIAKIQSTFPEWDSEKCPTTRHVLNQMRQRTVESGVENDKNTRNKSNKIKQSYQLGYALMAGALLTLVS